MTGTRPAARPRLQLEAISKRFPGCLANDDVSLDLAPGEIHALLGENGAGKSTLVKIIYGVLHADSGRLLWEGRPVTIANPAAARRLGIGMVFQHFSLFDSLTVTENIALGIGARDRLDSLAAQIREVAEDYGLGIDPQRHVHSLSVGERQRVEIVRCLLQHPKLLIMDEPTSVLTPQEAEKLFATLRRLAGEGCTVLYISHKLDEIRRLCERATILRNGRVVAECDPRRESSNSLAQMMVGGEVRAPRRPGERALGDVRLEVRNLSTTSDDPFATDVRDVGFSVHGGEILGIAGVSGNGQAELLAALSGEMPVADAQAIRLDGVAVGNRSARSRRSLGLGFVPEERLGRGAVPEMSLSENLVLSGYGRHKLFHFGLLRWGRAAALAEQIIERFNVVATGARAEARSLSGGNLQRFIIGREILQQPAVLVAAMPTWGVDARAAAEIHQALIDLARSGSAVVVVSQDLDELFAITDRIAVMFRGHLTEMRPTHSTTVEQVGLWMGGVFGHVVETEADVEAAAHA